MVIKVKNRKIFSPGLYFEGIRQTRLIGILSFIVLTFVSIVYPIGTFIIRLTNSARYDVTDISAVTKATANAFTMNPLLFFVFMLIAPIMTLSLFGFLNKRNTSDFWHSVPHTRLCLFTSFFLAIVTWIAAIIISTSLISSLVYTIFGKYFIPLYSQLIKYAIGCFVASLLVIAATALAMSITGTVMTNLILTVLILFLPRFFYFLADRAVASSLSILVTGHVFPMSGLGYNIVTDVVLKTVTFNRTDYLDLFFSPSALIYTTLLAVIYAVLAALLFVRRKSEAAAMSAPNRILQAVYRSAVTMVICIIPAFLIISSIGSLDSSVIVTAAVIYAFAIIVYFAYELITTKKFRNLARAIPCLFIVAALNALLIISGFAARNIALSFSPSADEIKSVELVNDEFARYYDGTINYIAYMQKKQAGYKITDPEIKKLVAERLADNIASIKNDESRFEYQPDMVRIKLIINTSSGSHYRMVRMKTDEYNRINEACFNNDDYRSEFTALPKYQNIGYIDGAYMSGLYDLTEKDYEDFYNTLREEVAGLDYNEWYDYLVSTNTTSTNSLSFNIVVGVYLNNKLLRVTFPVNGGVLPKTYGKWMSYVSSRSSTDFDKTIGRINEIIDKELGDQMLFVNISVNIFDSELGRYETRNFWVSIGRDKKDRIILDKFVSDMRDKITNDAPVYGENFIFVDFEGSYYDIENCIASIRGIDPTELAKLIDKYAASNGKDIYEESNGKDIYED